MKIWLNFWTYTAWNIKRRIHMICLNANKHIHIFIYIHIYIYIDWGSKWLPPISGWLYTLRNTDVEAVFTHHECRSSQGFPMGFSTSFKVYRRVPMMFFLGAHWRCLFVQPNNVRLDWSHELNPKEAIQIGAGVNALKFGSIMKYPLVMSK